MISGGFFFTIVGEKWAQIVDLVVTGTDYLEQQQVSFSQGKEPVLYHFSKSQAQGTIKIFINTGEKFWACF